MRIGFDLSPLVAPPSGIGTYAGNLFQRLRAIGEDEIFPIAHRPIAHLTSGQFKSLNKTLWMQAYLPFMLDKLNLSVAHFTNNVAPLWSPCPTVMTFHDMTLWMFPQYHTWRRLISLRPLIPLAAQRASKIITVSESSKADIIRILRIPREKVQVIYEGPAAQFQPTLDPSIENRIRKQYDLPEHFILYVGTIEPRKNLVRLAQAFAKLKGVHHLVFVGHRGWKDDPLFAEIESLNLSNRVRFLGNLSEQNLAGVYHCADLLAFPSLYEGFGLPVIEAMACGTPVLTSVRGSLREVAGDAAELVDPLSVESIADGLSAIIDNPNHQQDLRERGFQQVSQFSWQSTAMLTRQVYLQVSAPQAAKVEEPAGGTSHNMPPALTEN